MSQLLEVPVAVSSPIPDPAPDPTIDPTPGPTLDPADWPAFRAQGHRMLDDMFDYLQRIRERPVWQPIPDDVRARRRTAVPRLPTDLAAVHAEFMQDVLPFTAANVHPGFMGWVQGAGTPVGMLAEMLAAGLNANLGGRDQIPIEVEREIVGWVRQIFGFPETASGLFVTGTSMANLIAVAVARDATLGVAVRREGVAAQAPRLTAYASAAVHGCIAKAMDLTGLGSDALRLVPTDSNFHIDLDLLEQAIERDRAAGFTPFFVVGTAGTVDTGAVDDLSALSDLCRRQKLWFHVDGACGALAILAPDLAPRLSGIERADSLAFDFHKWGQIPYDAGFILVRDGAAHRAAFASPAAYLQRAARGLAAGSDWPCDYGPDLSRAFRALKTWFTLKVHGTAALASAIARTCSLARHIEARIAAAPELELLAPVELNIVCFRYRRPQAGALAEDRMNEEIVIKLQESGIAAPSSTSIAGRVAIRAAIVNHRTQPADVDALVDGVLCLGRALAAAALRTPSRPLPGYRDLNVALTDVNQRLEAEPGSVELLALRGNLLELTGRTEEAIAAYTLLLAVDPAHRGALNNLGNLLFTAGRQAEARTAYAQAASSHPADPMSQVNYANILRRDGELEQAQAHYALALQADPDYWQAHLGLSTVLADQGQASLAAAHRRAAFRGRSIIPLTYRGEQTPVTVLELVAIGPGNTRFKNFLSDRVFRRFLVATEFYQQSTPLPPHQLVVNSIGDADAAREALEGAQALLAHTDAPVINQPQAVLATGRCAIARRLAGLPGVLTANTVSLSRHVLAASDAAATLAAQGFAFPLLLRSPGFHQGEHFERVESPEDLPAVLATLPGPTLTVMQFLDARGRDGKTRKYRAMMIGGRLYPLHAAVSHHWKIHYFSAEMADHPQHRAEDAAFLEDMSSVIGPRALTALQAIQDTLGLDYGGIDFGLNEDGEVLLFEANATMAVIPPAPDPRWDYRRPAVARICAAVHAMLMEKADACTV